MFKRIHHGHKPANVLSGEARSLKVIRMFEGLQAQGWTFRFTTEAKSPRGFNYTGQGDSPLEAFLKAFGQWRSDFSDLIPKIPKIIAAQAEADKEAFKVKYAQVKAGRIAQRERLASFVKEALRNGSEPKVKYPEDRKREFRRIYMRAYRNRKRQEKGRVLVAA